MEAVLRRRSTDRARRGLVRELQTDKTAEDVVKPIADECGFVDLRSPIDVLNKLMTFQ